jgi:hypothetical protein
MHLSVYKRFLIHYPTCLLSCCTAQGPLTSEDDGIHLKTLTLTHDPEDTDMKTQTRLSVHHLSSHHQTDG